MPIPGLKIRVGLDGLLGLIPFAGDILTTAVSAYILAEAVRLRAPKTVLARMGFNVLVDTSLGSIPLLGDLFDFFWKSNQRNVRLLEGHIDRPRRTATASRLLIVALVVLSLAVLVLVIGLGVWALLGLWSALVASFF